MKNHQPMSLKHNLKHKKGTSSILFKLCRDNLSIAGLNKNPELLWCFTEVDIIAGGKVTFRATYDGSSYAKGNKVGDSLVNYYPKLSETDVNSPYGMGLFVYVPASAITEQQPMSFWTEEVKRELVQFTTLRLLNGHPPVEVDTVTKAIKALGEPPHLTADEWNSRRKAMMDSWQQSNLVSH